MNYQELADKFGYIDRHYNVGFIKYDESIMLKYAKAFVECRNELDNLGDDLTDKDYNRVKELLDKLERNICCYCEIFAP